MAVATDSFDQETGEYKFQQRIRKDPRHDDSDDSDDSEDVAVAEKETIAEMIPDRFFTLPSKIDFQDSHLANKSRYFKRLKQHQDRQQKYIRQAKQKYIAEWHEKMATVFPSFGVEHKFKKYDQSGEGGNVQRLKDILSQKDAEDDEELQS